jgi:regulator of replication initiation timing
VESLKTELRTAVSRRETTDIEKEEMGKELIHAIEKVEALKSEMQTAISEKKALDLETTKIDGRVANAMKELATKLGLESIRKHRPQEICWILVTS